MGAAQAARKRFGQHFLADRSVVARIVDAIDPQPGDSMVEIGPGTGALTAPLLERVRLVHAVELDRDLAAALRGRYPPERLVVHQADALGFDFASLASPLRVAGNLPYNISTPLLFRLAEFASHIRDIHVMLQHEVVERMVSAPSRASYGRLTVMLQYRFSIRRLFGVPPGAFRPPPQVDSAVVRMRPLGPAAPRARDEALFARVVAAAFSHRRKTLRNALSAIAGEVDLRACGIDPGLRAQDLALAQYIALADRLASARSAAAAR